MATGLEHKNGGYDYECVSPPPKSLECPVCLLTLRDPHIISCCGYDFCQVCIERVQRDGKLCPLCNAENFTTLLNKKSQREVNALVIRCPQKEQGCEWEGELGQLQRHLNPGAGISSSEGCDFVMIECAYQCGIQLQRRVIREHETEICLKRPIEMQVACLMKKFETVLVENQSLKQELEMHQQELDNLKQAHHEQKKELCEAKEKIVTLENKCTSLQTTAMPLPVPPFYVTMTNFSHYRMNSYMFKGDSFFSHPGGYKMVLTIQPNGSGERRGTHVSISVHLVPGEFDDQLHWPFNGRITVQAYSRTKGMWSYEQKIMMNAVKRCVDTSSGGYACHNFISFMYLDNYLRSTNSLRIRIARVEIY